MAAALRDKLVSRFGKDGLGEHSSNPKEPREGDLIGDEENARHLRWREHWNARPPTTELKPMTKPVHHVILTYTNTQACKGVEECDQEILQLQHFYQQEKGLPDIPYSFLVTADGNVYEARGWDYRPFVPKKIFPRMRGSRIVIAQVNQTFDKSILPPADNAIWDLIEFGIENDFIHSEAQKVMSTPWI